MFPSLYLFRRGSALRTGIDYVLPPGDQGRSYVWRVASGESEESGGGGRGLWGDSYILKTFQWSLGFMR